MNNFMASNGLDVDLFEERKTEKVSIHFGPLRGKLISFCKGPATKVIFFTENIAGALNGIDEIVQKFEIKYNSDVYVFSLDPYNYKVEPKSFGAVVTVEEYNEEEN